MPLSSGALRLALVALAITAWPLWALEPVVFDFEDPDSPLNEEWVVSPIDGPDQNVRISEENPRSGERSLKVYGKLPESFGVTYFPWRDWTGYARLSFDLWVPESVPPEDDAFDCRVYIKDAGYYWFETPLYSDPHTRERTREPARGRWDRFELDISPTSRIWVPGGHKRAWDERALYRPREFGLRFFGRRDWHGAVFIDNVTLGGQALPLGKRGVDPAPRVQPVQLRPTANATSVPMYEKFELTFELDRAYTNPFDPEVVDVQGHFVSPSGNRVSVPGFYYQEYERSLSEDGFERLIPAGAPCWKVRFAPRETGRYSYWVTVDDAAGRVESAAMNFQATAPLDPRGFVRVSRSDPLYFEFGNGEWFWPIAINMRDGGDDASDQKGTYDFDHFFQRFEEEGINFVRTWMCAWWGGIEWSDEYHSRYQNIGRYNQYNAWRMDYMVDLAREHDIYLEVTFNNHGQVRRDKFDEEWTYNPWNPRNSGHVASPAMFFSSERVKEEFRKRYRYIVARWGYSRNIMSWDLWNEVDLVENYDPGLVSEWHREMASYLKTTDPWKRIISTHICLFWSFGDEMWRLPEIEFIKSDAYWDQRDDKRMDMGMYASYLRRVRPQEGFEPRFDKPFVFIEYGPLYTAVTAGRVTDDIWRHRFRVGMWTSAVLPNAMPAVFWYNREWEELGLHEYQQPLIELFADHDRRGKGYRMRTVNVADAEDLHGIGMIGDTEGFFYFHHPERIGPPDREGMETTEGAKAAISRVRPGTWDIEFIDTLTAEVIGRAEAEVPERPSLLRFDLPPVADELLVRVKLRP